MPSRVGVALIVAFWLAVTGYVVHRDVWPRLFGDAPPAVRIDLSDEATQTVPARWYVYRGDQQVGTLTTVMRYVEADDTFRFASRYTNLRFDVSGLRCEVPELDTTVDVSRDGDLRGQTMTGKLQASVMAGPVPVFNAEATASVSAVVRDGQLVGRCVIKSPLGDIDQPLDPVPVPAGQVLNPLQPVNRLRGVRPGQRWVVHEVNPLADALKAMARGLLKQHTGTVLANLNGGSGDRPVLIAQVSDRPENLPPSTRLRLSPTAVGVTAPVGPIECWVIEYRGDHGTAKTWVRVGDGKVMRQEAAGQGETLRLERED